MKKTITLFLATAMAIGLSGCSLFSTGDAPAQNATESSIASEEGNMTSSDPYAITDAYTHEDPEDLEYDQRYILTTGQEPPQYVDSFKSDYGVEFVEQLAVIYINKEDKVVGEYDYYVFASPEDAKTFGDAIETQARGGIIEGNVVCEFMDEEMIGTIIDIDVQYGSIPEATGTEYIKFMKDINMMMTAN